MKIEYNIEIEILKPFDIIGKKIIHTGIFNQVFTMIEFTRALKILEARENDVLIYGYSENKLVLINGYTIDSGTSNVHKFIE